jgi:hypothetical protein
MNPARQPMTKVRRCADGSTYNVQWRHPAWYADVYDLWRMGLNDGEIARCLDRPVSAIYTARGRQMKLPRNNDPGHYDRSAPVGAEGEDA